MTVKTMELNQLLIDMVCELIEKGASRNTALRTFGVSSLDYRAWMDEARFPDYSCPLHAEFRRRIGQAEASARAVAEMTTKQQKPDVWLLKGPGGKAKKEDVDDTGWGDSIELTGKGGKDLLPGPTDHRTFQESRLTADELAHFKRLLAKGCGLSGPALAEQPPGLTGPDGAQ